MEKVTAVKKLHVSEGNSKIGKIMNLNLLCGDDNLKGLTDVQGSCTGVCSSCKNYCYGMKSYRYRTAIQAHSDNTKYAREDVHNFFKELNAVVSKRKPELFRFHSHGEIISKDYFAEMCNMAAANTSTKFYVYSKQYDIINDYLNSHTKPENLNILFSPEFTCDTLEKINTWNAANNPHNLPLFIYDAGTDSAISKLCHCPAVDAKGHKTGIKCSQCKRCMTGKTTAVYAH